MASPPQMAVRLYKGDALFKVFGREKYILYPPVCILGVRGSNLPLVYTPSPNPHARPDIPISL